MMSIIDGEASSFSLKKMPWLITVGIGTAGQDLQVARGSRSKATRRERRRSEIDLLRLRAPMLNMLVHSSVDRNATGLRAQGYVETALRMQATVFEMIVRANRRLICAEHLLREPNV